jgi:hypothetical protein
MSNTKHLLTFHTKREVTHTNVIAFTRPSNLKSIPSTQPKEGPPSYIVRSSKKSCHPILLGGLGLFYISNCYKSNFVSSLVELNFDKANKEGNKETNPIGLRLATKRLKL